jgi:transcriptional regulator with GAF, ATPase, and Fis domain
MLEQQDILTLFESLFEPIEEGVIICHGDGTVIAANPSVRRLFELDEHAACPSLANLGGHDLRSTLARTGRPQEGAEGLTCGIAVDCDEDFDVNGQRRWLRIHSRQLDLPGRPQALRMIVMRDITPERKLQAVIGNKEACGIESEDPDMLRLIHRLTTVAASNASVLLQGESGAGKTELARLIHRRSPRSHKPFVEINCGAIPGNLIETELFGHVRGAFTGAVKDRDGRFKAADGGTLFLDEIGELPKELQPKLLRVLQDGEYEPVGSDRTVKVDVRLVCASNQDLRENVDNGLFRADLYYRIAVVPLRVPPLRNRPGDIPLLIDAIYQRLVMRNYPADVAFSHEAMHALMNYAWPGNVRELANAVEHCVICAEDGIVTRDSLPDTIRLYSEARSNLAAADPATFDDSRKAIETALHRAKGNKTLAAQMLGIDRTTLWRRMQRLGLA